MATTSKTGVERTRAYRQRKKNSEHGLQTTINENSDMPGTESIRPGPLPQQVSTDAMEEAIFIKTLIFQKQSDPYKIPLPPEKIKQCETFNCQDCGDTYLFKSSYDFHINRKSMQISFKCTLCAKTMIFFNRCSVLRHLRSHTSKTITINLSDIQIEPIAHHNIAVANSLTAPELLSGQIATYTCPDCKKRLIGDYLHHYADDTKKINCTICYLQLTSECAMKSHYRVHILREPLICTDCGRSLRVLEFFNKRKHVCKLVDRISDTSYIKCRGGPCKAISFSNFLEHFSKSHMKNVFKCTLCTMVFLNKHTLKNHVEKRHPKDSSTNVCNDSAYFSCSLCPGRLVFVAAIKAHTYNHMISFPSAFYCRKCSLQCDSIFALQKHAFSCVSVNEALVFNEDPNFEKNKSCQNCNNAVNNEGNCTKCNTEGYAVDAFQNINPIDIVEATYEVDIPKISCCLCSETISQDWNDIKVHFKEHHKNYACLDPVVRLKKLTVKDCESLKSTYSKKGKATRMVYKCWKCSVSFDERSQLTSHVKTHSNVVKLPKRGRPRKKITKMRFEKKPIIDERDDNALYECLECGQRFAAKPSFATHLVINHSIEDVDLYIEQNQRCFNVKANEAPANISSVDDEPLKENQCKVCREQCSNEFELDKHMRVHGSAYLEWKKQSKTPSPN